MATLTPTESGSHSSVPASPSRIGWAGIAFGVLLVVGFFFAGGPDSSGTDAEIQKWWADGAHQRFVITGAYLLVIAGFALLALVAGLMEEVRATRDSAPVLFRFAWGAGIIAAGFMLVTALQAAGIAGNIIFGSTPDVKDADLLRQNLGIASLLLTGAFASAVFIGAVATLARRAEVFGAGMMWFSYVVAVLLLFAVAFFPMAALPIWGVVTGIVLLRRR